MSNPDSSNNSENKGVNAQKINGNFTYTTVKGDYNITTVSLDKNSKANNILAAVSNAIGKM